MAATEELAVTVEMDLLGKMALMPRKKLQGRPVQRVVMVSDSVASFLCFFSSTILHFVLILDVYRSFIQVAMQEKERMEQTEAMLVV